MAETDESPDLAARLAVIEERLAAMEQHGQEAEGLEPVLARLFPTEVRGHLRAARKEQLLAVRSLIDHWIDRLERAPAERVRRRESIKLE